MSKRLSHLEKEPNMRRSALAFLALLILLSFASAPAPARGQQVTHEVTEGETLWTIAQEYLGDGHQWTAIFEANRATLQDPDRLEVGMVLVIPGVEPPAAEVQEVTVVTPGEPAEEPAAEPMEAMPAQTAPAQALMPCPGPQGRTIFYEGGTGARGCDFPVQEERTAFFFDPSKSDPGGSMMTGGQSMTVAVPEDAVFAAEWLIPYGAEPAALGKVEGFARAELDRTNRTQAMTHELLQVTLEDGAGVMAGDLLQAFKMVRDVDGVGRILRPTGILSVEEVEGAGVVGRVVKEFSRVRLGNWVRPLPSYSLAPGQEAEAVDSDLTATILTFADDRVIYSIGSTALLDAGRGSGITIGDEFAAYVNTGQGWSEVEAARLQVVLVGADVSTARIIAVREPTVDPGDEVKLVRKMR